MRLFEKNDSERIEAKIDKNARDFDRGITEMFILVFVVNVIGFGTIHKKLEKIEELQRNKEVNRQTLEQKDAKQ